MNRRSTVSLYSTRVSVLSAVPQVYLPLFSECFLVLDTAERSSSSSPCTQVGKQCRHIRVALANVSHHHRLLQRKSASRLCCRPCNSEPAGAAAPGPPGSRPLRAPGRGSWGPRGGCRKHWQRDAGQRARGRAQDPTGGKS